MRCEVCTSIQENSDEEDGEYRVVGLAHYGFEAERSVMIYAHPKKFIVHASLGKDTLAEREPKVGSRIFEESTPN